MLRASRILLNHELKLPISTHSRNTGGSNLVHKLKVRLFSHWKWTFLQSIVNFAPTPILSASLSAELLAIINISGAEIIAFYFTETRTQQLKRTNHQEKHNSVNLHKFSQYSSITFQWHSTMFKFKICDPCHY